MRPPVVLRWLALLLALLPLSASSASAQFTLSSSSTQTGASASTPSCNDFGNGGVGVPLATASCSGPAGYNVASSASASVVTNANGAALEVSAESAAVTPGTLTSKTSNGNAFATSFASWSVSASVLYSISVAGSTPLSITGNLGVVLPPAGLLVAGDTLTVSFNPNVTALARDSGPVTDAAAASGEAEVTLVPLGASDLIMGTVLADGNAMAGLLVEALVSGSPIASTQTASDGSYLLPGLPGSVVLRLSDPGGQFVTELSPTLTPPATYDADLAPTPSVPGLPLTGGGILWGVCAVLGSRALGRPRRGLTPP